MSPDTFDYEASDFRPEAHRPDSLLDSTDEDHDAVRRAAAPPTGWRVLEPAPIPPTPPPVLADEERVFRTPGWATGLPELFERAHGYVKDAAEGWDPDFPEPAVASLAFARRALAKAIDLIDAMADAVGEGVGRGEEGL